MDIYIYRESVDIYIIMIIYTCIIDVMCGTIYNIWLYLYGNYIYINMRVFKYTNSYFRLPPGR